MAGRSDDNTPHKRDPQMNDAKKQRYTTQGKLYFQRGVDLPYPQHEGSPVVLNVPEWMERLAAWLDRFVRLVP